MKIARLAFTVGFLTLISRVFGYLRDVTIAFFLGASVLNDIFIIALRLPNMFRTIFGEGAFSAAFVPIFAKELKKDGQDVAKRFAEKTQIFLLIALVIFSVVMMIFMEEVLYIMAPGYANDPEMVGLAVTLGRISFPYIIFVSLMAFYGGISNAMGHFKAFASAPILMNIVLILFVFLGDTQLSKVYWLTASIVVAGVAELLWMIYFVRKSFGYVKIVRPVVDDEIKTLFKKIVPGIFGSGIAQINILISTVIASFVVGGVSYLYYADRIYQLPLAIIGTALGTVMLPVLSKHAEASRMLKFKVLQNRAILFAMYLTLPATVLILILAEPIIGFLFEHGEFGVEATRNVAFALQIFALGLPMYSLTKICTSAFFALGNTKTPVQVGALSLIVNIVISFTFLPMLSYASVALGSVVASYFTVTVFIHKLIKQDAFVIYTQMLRKTVKLSILAVALGVLGFIMNMFFNVESYFTALLFIGAPYGIIYLIASHMLGFYKFSTLKKH